MSMDKHIAYVCKAAYLELRSSDCIRYFLTVDMMQPDGADRGKSGQAT